MMKNERYFGIYDIRSVILNPIEKSSCGSDSVTLDPVRLLGFYRNMPRSKPVVGGRN